MIEVYLQRHGVAEDIGPGGRDSERRLTAEGRKKLRQILGRALKAGAKPNLILTSPYKRALSTAEIAAKILSCPGEIL